MDLLPSDRLSFSFLTLFLFTVSEALTFFFLITCTRKSSALLSALICLDSFFDCSKYVLVDATLY